MARLPDVEYLRRQVADKLTPARYRHSLAVQKQAMTLAKRHGADWYKAGVAGLLHDICHDMPYDAQLNYLRSCGILLDVIWLDHPTTWHAACGSVYAETVLGIDDPEILSAIRYHTTGRRAMTLLEKVVYVADLTSEDRDFPDAPALRQMADRSLDEAMEYGLCYIMEKLIQHRASVMQDTWEAYNYYLTVGKELRP